MKKSEKIAIGVVAIGMLGIGLTTLNMSKNDNGVLEPNSAMESLDASREETKEVTTKDVLREHSVELFEQKLTSVGNENQENEFGYSPDESFDWKQRIAEVKESMFDEESALSPDISDKELKAAKRERTEQMNTSLYSATLYQPSKEEIELFYNDLVESYQNNDYLNKISSEDFALDIAFKSKVVALSEEGPKSDFAANFSELIEIGYKDANVLTADVIIDYQSKLILEIPSK